MAKHPRRRKRNSRTSHLPEAPFHVQQLPKKVYHRYMDMGLVRTIEEVSATEEDGQAVVTVYRTENDMEVWDEWRWQQSEEDARKGRPWKTWVSTVFQAKDGEEQ